MSNITISQPVSTCLISGMPVTKILDFGQHPYADTFIAEHQETGYNPDYFDFR